MADIKHGPRECGSTAWLQFKVLARGRGEAVGLPGTGEPKCLVKQNYNSALKTIYYLRKWKSYLEHRDGGNHYKIL